MLLNVKNVVRNGMIDQNLVDNIQKKYWTAVSENHYNMDMANEDWFNFIKDCSEYVPDRNPHHFSQQLILLIKKLIKLAHKRLYESVQTFCPLIISRIAPSANVTQDNMELVQVPSRYLDLQTMLSNISFAAADHADDFSDSIRELKEYTFGRID